MKNRNLIESFNNAVNGIVYTIKAERNMKIHIVAAFTVIFLSLFYKLSKVEFLILCVTVGLVIICELFNTAIEVLVNLIVDFYHPKAKIIKDVAAGAVFTSALISLVVGYFIFFDKVSKEVEYGIQRLQRSDMNITLFALFASIAVVVALKLFFKRGTPFSGGMPSGHAAIAFSVTTAIAFWGNSITITMLCLFISLLVLQSRLEGKIHNALELAAGAAVGFLVTLLIYQLLR